MEENESDIIDVTETKSTNSQLYLPSSDSEVFTKVHRLEEANQKMQTEFNMQRAKLRDLFMQKETEYNKCQTEKQRLQYDLDEMKSQFVVADLKSQNEIHVKEVKAQEEISSLQQLVQDTIEESTFYKTELEHLKEENDRIRSENKELREHQQDSSSLGPQVFNQVKKTLARKLGGETTMAFTGLNVHQEGVDNPSKEGENKYAHEDAEVLRSIVVQLQEEMKALKEKLREADEKLHTGDNERMSSTANITSSLIDSVDSNEMQNDHHLMNKSTSVDILDCKKCDSCDEKMQDLLVIQTATKKEIDELQKVLREAHDSLQKEAGLRKVLEDQWQQKRDEHKTEVQGLRDQVKRNERKLLELQEKFLKAKEDVNKQLQLVSDERDRVNKHLETLQADNDFLSGRYLATAAEIENQYINLPNVVDELQELILRQQSELIQARVSTESEKQKRVTSHDEIQILHSQLKVRNNEFISYKKKVQTDMKKLQDRLTEHMLMMQKYEVKRADFERKETDLNRQIAEIRVENIELQEKNEKLNKMNADYKVKIKNLQDDLVTSEQVQKDFVKLSQTLQMSLEKLRNADTEVRWQDDNDVDNCPSCNAFFTVTVRKLHCRHCGNIYCDKCLSKSVPSGPRKRLARVCDICHTLLTPNTAPYFSQKSIQSS